MVKRKKSLQKALLAERVHGVDRLLIFRFFRLLHGRFWGLGSVISILVGAVIGYSIRPDFFGHDIPLSELGTDVRTAPFFAGSIFFAAYSLWRWRIYLSRTLKNAKPVIPLISVTIFGLYLVALMPVSWEVLPHRIHNIGFGLVGASMAATVLLDSIFSHNRYRKRKGIYRFIKLSSFLLVATGGVLSFLSIEGIEKLQLILVGEGLMFAGYSIWVLLKIYLGEGRQSAIGKIVQKLLY